MCRRTKNARGRARVDSDILIITSVTSTRVKEHKKSIFSLSLSLSFVPPRAKGHRHQSAARFHCTISAAWELLCIRTYLHLSTTQRNYYVKTRVHAHTRALKKKRITRRSENRPIIVPSSSSSIPSRHLSLSPVLHLSLVSSSYRPTGSQSCVRARAYRIIAH